MNDPIINKAIEDLKQAQNPNTEFADAQRIRLNVIKELHKYKSTIPRGQEIRIQCENLMSQAEEEWSIEEESNR